MVDFHALRATYITLLVKSGASVKIVQELARHSDPKLTLNIYSKLGVHELSGALDRLPSLTPARPNARAWGRRAPRMPAPRPQWTPTYSPTGWGAKRCGQARRHASAMLPRARLSARVNPLESPL